MASLLDRLVTDNRARENYLNRDPRVSREEQAARIGLNLNAVESAQPSNRRRSESGLNALTSRYSSSYAKEAQRAAKAEAKAIEDATASAGDVITQIETPDGILPAQGPSGAPYLVRKPGSSTILVDPASGEELAPDVMSPTGLKSVTAEKANVQADKATLRSRKETAKIYEGVQKDITKEQEEARKAAIGEQTNEYLRQGRKYYLDRVSGEPIPVQSDEEFKATQQEKMAKLAEESRAKQLKRKISNLRLDEETIQLDRKPPTDSEYNKLKEEKATLLEAFSGFGAVPDEAGLAKVAAQEGGGEMVSKFKEVQNRLQQADEARNEIDSLKRKRLDIERQLANPDEWKAEQDAVIQNGTEADLDERIKQDTDVVADLDETIKAESEPLLARDAQFKAELDKADADMENALTGDERIAAQRKRDNILARASVWEAESAEQRASLNESTKLRNQRVETANAAQQMRQSKAIADRKASIAEIAKTPFLAPTAAKIQALDEEEAKRLTDIQNLPPEQQEAAKAIVAEDITKKRVAVDQELKYNAQTVEANIRGLYEKYGKGTRTQDWLTENDPQNVGLLFNLMQDAKKVGLTEEQVRKGMEDWATFDWSNPRKLDSRGQGDFSEETRKFTNGDIIVNPRYLLDEEEYKKVVEKSDATPEAKAKAIANRREQAAPLAARALSELMEDPQMGSWIQSNTKGTPLERMEQFNAKLKDGGALATAYNGFRAGSGSLARTIIGAGAAVTGSDWMTDAATYYGDHATAYAMAQEAAGKGTGTLGRFAGKVAGAVPSLVPAVAIGLATGGLGLGTSASLISSSLASGLQSSGGVYMDAYEAGLERGLSQTEARSKALAPAIVSGLITSTLTQLGGARGVESLFKTATPEAVKAGLKATLANIATNAGEEALEEFSDQALQGLLASATYTPEKSIEQALTEAVEAGLVGMTLGGGIAAIKGTGGKADPSAPAEGTTPPTAPAPEVPGVEAAAPTEVMPEVKASLEAIIKEFKPDVATLPQAIKASAKVAGVAKSSQDAARAILAVAQGQALDTLPSGLLESVGLTRTDKGIVAKDKKISPLIEIVKGQPVIRNEAIDWLEQNGMDLLREQIGKTEGERLAEINAPETLKAGNENAPTVTKTNQETPPVTKTTQNEQAPTPPPAQPETAPTAEAAPKAKKAVKEPAPKKTTLLIGKGRGGQSVKAQFTSEVDADAFSYVGANKKLTTGRNLSANERTRLAKRSADTLQRVKDATGLSDAELRPLLADYSAAVREQAKAAKPGDSIKPQSFQDFVASKTLPPASQAQEEGSQGIVTQAGEGSISPVTESSVTPTENVSSPVIETKTQEDKTPSGKASAALGITKDGKIVKDSFLGNPPPGFTPAQRQRLVSAAKSLVNALAKIEKIKGVKIVIVDDSNVMADYAPDGSIRINPRDLVAKMALRAKDASLGPQTVIIHELIHKLAEARLNPSYYQALWASLPEATKEASLNEYFRGIPKDQRPDFNAYQAGAEFFAQIIEARLKGDLASQVWENPSLTEQVMKMIRDYIAALRDLAGLITDPQIRQFVNNAADAVESDVRAALKEAGIEEDFLQDKLAAPLPSSLSRMKGSKVVEFSTPIKTPLGLVKSYQWQSTLEEGFNKEGEAILRRVSDWDKAAINAETGRDIVHHFNIETPDGTKTVSLESTMKSLAGTDAAKMVKGAIAAARRLAVRKSELAELTAQKDAYEQALEKAQRTTPPNPELKESDWPMLQKQGKKQVWIGGVELFPVDPNNKSEWPLSGNQLESARSSWFKSQIKIAPPNYARIFDLEALIKKDQKKIRESQAQMSEVDVNQPLSAPPVSVTPAQDAEYLAAVESGDMVKAQKMVDEIRLLPRSIFYVKDIEVIRNPSHSDYRKLTTEYEKELPFDNSGDPKTRSTTDKFGNRWIWRSDQGMHSSVEPGIKLAEKRDVNQNAYNWNRKNGDPVTRDASGNIIPLSQRFNEESNSILYAPRPPSDSGTVKEISGVPSEKIFQTAKERHGLTSSLYEAGYVLPDGAMLDFSGRADAGYVKGADLRFKPKPGERDWMKDQRGVDHREVEWEGQPEYKEMSAPMIDFMRVGAIRMDQSGAITIHGRFMPTSAQQRVLRDLVTIADGAYLDLEDDNGNRASLTLDGAKWPKVKGFIQRWANGDNLDEVTYLYAPLPPESLANAAYQPDPSQPAPISPDSDVEAPSEADDQESVRRALEDMEAYEDLRNDPVAMKALQEQMQNAPEGKLTPDPKNRALMGLTPETRAAQQAALVAQTQNGIEVQRQAAVFARAREAVATNRAAVEKQLFSKIESETLFDMDDIAMAQQITEKMQREITLNPSDTALYKRYMTLTNYWADNKTNVARSLAIMRDPQQTPLDRMRQSIAVVGIPPLKVRMQIRAAWTPKEKSAQIKTLEKQLADVENDAQVKLLEVESEKQDTITRIKAEYEAALAAAKARPDKDQLMNNYIEESKRTQAEILSKMQLSNDDVMLNPEDRYAVRQSVMDSPGVKAAMAKFSAEQRAAVNLAVNGYSDAEIAKRTGFKPDEVAKIAENFRQNILKPAIAAEVKAGKTFASMLQSGFEKLKNILRAPETGEFDQLAGQGDITAQNATAIAAEIDRILDFTMQPARRRNRPGSLVAKVIQTPNGQKVRMFIPFDPDDARAFYRYAREMSTRDASGFDKVYEYWINGILSGPQTQVANIAGNLGQIAWHYTAQRSAEAILNIAYNDPKTARLGEFPHVFKAFYQAVAPAWNQAMLAWDTEADNTRTEYLNEPLTADFKDSNLDKVGGQRSSIQGKKGRIIRIPGRALRFFDSLFKTAVLHAEASAIAYREGRQLGLKGQALQAHMQTRLDQKGNSVWQEAMTVADDLLFQSDNWATMAVESIVKSKNIIGPRLQKGLANAEAEGDATAAGNYRKAIAVANFVQGVMRFLFPFTRTPTNILRVGVRKSGGAAISGLFGITNGLWQVYKGKPFTSSYSKAEQVKDLSETFLAGLAWATLAGMAEGDDDDDKKMILMVGNRPYGAGSAGEKAEVMRKYGGTQVVIFRNPSTGEEVFRFNYGRYEPFATAMGVMVDTMREIKQAGKTEEGIDSFKLAGSIGSHLMAQAESKSFLQGLAGIARTTEQIRANQFEPGPAAGKFIITSIVPNLIRQSVRNADDLQRDYKSGWKHEAWPSGRFAEPVIGPAGEPVKKGGNVLSRLAFQVPNVPSKPTSEQVLQQYNLRNPANRIERANLTKAQMFAYKADNKTRLPLEDPKDKRAFTALYERIYAKRLREKVAELPMIKLPKPPFKVVDEIKEVNPAALKEAREKFLENKLVQQSLSSAK